MEVPVAASSAITLLGIEPPSGKPNAGRAYALRCADCSTRCRVYAAGPGVSRDARPVQAQP
jgi:hypothetical protein